ncbi:MAG: PQQ-binding-like beta-propeller repeat protein [Planctomycetota bacterium]
MNRSIQDLPRLGRWSSSTASRAMVARCLLALPLIAMAIAAPSTIRAQGIFRSRGVMPAAEPLPMPRGLRQQVRQGQEAILEGRLNEGVVILGDLLRREAQLGGIDDAEWLQDYFILDPESELLENSRKLAEMDRRQQRDIEAWKAQSPSPISLMTLIREIIGRLPKAGLDVYELQYGPLARKALREASRKRDWNAVASVRRQFFHTLAGYEASMLLAHRDWHQGNALAASVTLDDVVIVPRAVDHCGDGLVVLHAMARRTAGRELSKPMNWPAAVTEALPDPPDMAAWRRWIDARVSTEPLVSDPISMDYPMLGGVPSRNGQDDGQLPLSHPRWMLETSGSPRQERLIQQKTAELKSAGYLSPPSWTPLRVGDQLLMRTTQRLLGVDYRSGKRVWQYPWFSPPDPKFSGDDEDADPIQRDPADLLAQRVWNDSPFGQLSSDGQRVFMLDDLGIIEIQRFGPFGPRGIQDDSLNRNTLVALDLATEGKLLWRLGSQETVPTPFANAFFLGPPLPANGRLYAMVELAGSIVLVCLHPEDGTEDWRQVLVSAQAGRISLDPIRRVAGAMPTLHQGILICPTGGGATVAVNLADRTLRWINEYQRNQQFNRSVIQTNMELSMTELSRRWNSSAAIASGRDVVLTPVESDRCIVADVLTGKNRFNPTVRLEDLYVAGIRNGQYIVVGPNTISGRRLVDGRILWSTESDLVEPGEGVAGRGVFGRESYFVPTTADELVEVSLTDGSVISRRQVRFPLGNLVAVNGELISQGSTMLAVAYGESALRPRVDAMLRDNPDDFSALVRKAELLIEQGDRVDALEVLDRARAIEPDNDEVLMLSVTAMLGTIREDPLGASVDLDMLNELIERPDQRAELLVLQIEAFLRQARESTDDEADARASACIQAISLLQEFSRLLIKEPSLNDAQPVIFPSLNRRLSIHAWVSARVAELYSIADASTAVTMDESISESLNVIGRDDVSAMEVGVRHFSASDESAALRARLARRQLELGDSLAAERWSLGEGVATNEALERTTEEDLAILHELYDENRWLADQWRVDVELRSRRGESPASGEPAADDSEQDVGLGPLSDPLLAALDGQLAMNPDRPPNHWRAPDQWPPNVKLDWQVNNAPRSRSMLSNRTYDHLQLMMGDHLIGWKVMESSAAPISVINPDGFSRPLGVEGAIADDGRSREIIVSGGLMVVMTTSELIAIDLFQALGNLREPAVRWRRPLSSDGKAIAKRISSTSAVDSQIYRYRMNSEAANRVGGELRLGPVMTDRLFLMRGTELICLDLLSGETLWSTTQFAPGGAIIADRDRVAIASDRNRIITILDARDGSTLKSEPRMMETILASAGTHVLVLSRFREMRRWTAERPNDELRAAIDSVIDLEADFHEPLWLELLNPLTGKLAQFTITSPNNSTGQPRSASNGHVVDGRYFTLIDDSGHVRVWDLLTGGVVAEADVELTSTIDDFATMRVDQKLLLLPRCRRMIDPDDPTANLAGFNTSVNGSAAVSPLSQIHAISLALPPPRSMTIENESGSENVGGELLWSRQFDLPWACTTTQPWSTPVLILDRSRIYTTAGATNRRREMDVACLDIHTGRTMHQLDGKQVFPGNSMLDTWVKLIPHRNEIRVDMQSENLTYTFSDEPDEPAQDESPRNPGTREDGVVEGDTGN